jgi:hypothetical protein
MLISALALAICVSVFAQLRLQRLRSQALQAKLLALVGGSYEPEM